MKYKFQDYWGQRLLSVEDNQKPPCKLYKGFSEGIGEVLFMPEITHCREQGGSYNFEGYKVYLLPDMSLLVNKDLDGVIFEVEL